MKRIPWRGILFYSFVAFFLIASVVLVLYGTGYRYSASKRTLEKTGELILESQPSGANVFFDGNDTGKKTPLHMKYILPGAYRLTIKKDGYASFVREISISSGLVTIVNDVVLVKDLPPVLIFSHPDRIEEFSAVTAQSIFFKTKKAFFAYDRVTMKTKELLRTPKKITVVTSPQSPSLYVYSDTHAYIVKKSTTQITQAASPPPTMHTLVWPGSEELFGITSKGVVAYDPSSMRSEYIVRGLFSDLAVYDTLLTAIEERDGRVYLLQIDRMSRDKKSTRIEIQKKVRRFVKDTYPFAIFETKQREFFKIDEATLAPSAPIKEIQKFVFPPSSARIAASEYEIWIFEKGDSEKDARLLLRRSDPIIHALLIPSAPYVLVQSAHDLQLLEIGNHPTQNQYEIVSQKNISDSIVDPKEKKIFFAISEEGGSEVFERLLVD